MEEYLSLKEFGEIHGKTEESMRVLRNKDLKRPPERRLVPPADVVIGGGRLRGIVPGLEPMEEDSAGGRSDARYGWKPVTALTWERPGAGTRTDLMHPGTKTEYTAEQVEAAKRVIATSYALAVLLVDEPIGGDDAERNDWKARYQAAVEDRSAARTDFAAAFDAGATIPAPQTVLHQHAN